MKYVTTRKPIGVLQQPPAPYHQLMSPSSFPISFSPSIMKCCGVGGIKHVYLHCISWGESSYPVHAAHDQRVARTHSRSLVTSSSVTIHILHQVSVSMLLEQFCLLMKLFISISLMRHGTLYSLKIHHWVTPPPANIEY